MNRHRFNSINIDQLCGVRVGEGVCVLPYRADMHFNDNDHPFEANPRYPDECGWMLQEGELAGTTCAGSIDDGMHGEAVSLFSYESVAPVAVHMQYPKEEPKMVQEPDWQRGNVYPPSDDGGEPERSYQQGGNPWAEEAAREADPPTERLEVEAKDYRWTNHEGGPTEASNAAKKAASVSEAYLEHEWQRAVEWLEQPETGLLYGPWPVRKFVLWDMPEAMVPEVVNHEQSMLAHMAALNRLGIDYCLMVTREEGRPYRTALLTSGPFLGLDLATVCDELATVYG